MYCYRICANIYADSWLKSGNQTNGTRLVSGSYKNFRIYSILVLVVSFLSYINHHLKNAL